MDNIQIYTDGCCLKNPGLGGLAAIILVNGKKTKVIVDSYGYTTNNRMEILASIQAIEYSFKAYPESRITLYSDSQYLVKSFNYWMDGWITNNLKKENIDLFQRLYILKYKYPNKIIFSWVKGHDGNRFNEMCDHLAKKAAYDNSYKKDVGYLEQKLLNKC